MPLSVAELEVAWNITPPLLPDALAMYVRESCFAPGTFGFTLADDRDRDYFSASGGVLGW